MSAIIPSEVFSYILNVCESNDGDDCEYGDRNQKQNYSGQLSKHWMIVEN